MAIIVAIETGKSSKHERQVAGISHDYFIEQNGKRKKFSHFKQLYRLYPVHRGALENHVAEHEVDFNDVSSIVALCHYAEGL